MKKIFLVFTVLLNMHNVNSQIPTAGRVLHLDANIGFTGSGTAAAAWADQSGNGNNCTVMALSTGAPTQNAVNGFQAINFGGNVIMRSATTNTVTGTVGTIVLVKTNNGNGAPVSVANDGTVNNELVIQDNVTYHHSSASNWVGKQHHCTGTIPANSPMIIAGTFNTNVATSDISNFTNGAISTSAMNTLGVAVAYTANNRRIYVGSRNQNGALHVPFTGNIFEVIIYNRILNAVELNQVYETLKCKYNVNYAACNLNPNTNATIVNSKKDTLCIGDSTILTANPAGMTYAWNTTPSKTTQSIAVKASGTYTVTVTTPNGCTSIASRIIVFRECCPDECFWNKGGNINVTSTNNIIGTMSTTNVQDFRIFTAGTQKAVVTTSGNIGINNLAPSNRLEVTHGTAGNSGLRLTNLISGTSTTTNNANQVLSVTSNGDVVLVNTNQGISSSCSTQFYVPRVNITGSSNLTCSQIYDNGSSVGISSTGPFNYTLTTIPPFSGGTVTTTGTLKLDVNGIIRCTGIFATSDEKLKTEINSIKSAKSIISKLNGKTYFWNKQYAESASLDNGRHYGFLAQELEKVMPEAVLKDNHGRYAVEYNALIPVLVESQKELINENETLKAKISSLEERFTLLENSLVTICESGCIGLKKEVKNMDVLYQSIPNPTDDVALINYILSQDDQDAYISVFSNEGKQLKTIRLESKIGKGNVKISLTELSAGVYPYSLIISGKVIDTKRLQIIR
ncbi:MAG: tail fiber domain-containing protein [Chitinophagales bacterium]|nr:tail fiber domain-containing protein [Chitinophagales bacterium]